MSALECNRKLTFGKNYKPINIVKMEPEILNGAKSALLDEYARALKDLQRVIATVDRRELITIVDWDTDDPNCHSIQTILAHVVRSAFSYATYIRQQQGEQLELRPLNMVGTAAQFQEELTAAFEFTRETFLRYPAIELEVMEADRKMLVQWGQLYDTEQLMEHAIVHILRHRRQIERFLSKLRTR